MERLEFSVQGSATEPYRVIAEGAGPSLRVFCTCPAGRRGGKFCKHAAQLLVGDVTRVTSGADAVPELLRRAAQSGLTDRALAHDLKDKRDRVPGVVTIDDVIARYSGALEGLGWQIGRERGDGRDVLGLYRAYKNGRRHKHPKVVMAFEAMTCDHSFLPDGTSVEVNHRPRVRPWTVRAASKPGGTWGRADKAALAFLAAAGLEESAIFG